MSNIKIHASILCANHGKLSEEIIELEKAQVDYFHMDVMDGDFVPNFGVGTEMFNAVKKAGSLPLDTHLMINNPAKHINRIRELGSEIITIHPEADRQCAATLLMIKNLGAKPGIAINPGTSIESIKELLPICEHILVMTVNPGFGGQKFLDFTINKISELCSLSNKYGFSICLDGGIDTAKVKEFSKLGVKNFVIGSAIFREGPEKMMGDIRKINI